MSESTSTEQPQEQNFDPTQYPTGEQLDMEYSKQMAQLGVLDYEERSLWARLAEIQARLDEIREAKGNIDGIVTELQATKTFISTNEFKAQLVQAELAKFQARQQVSDETKGVSGKDENSSDPE